MQGVTKLLAESLPQLLAVEPAQVLGRDDHSRGNPIDEQSQHLRHWNRSTAHVRIHSTTRRQVFAHFEQTGKKALQPPVTTPFAIIESESRPGSTYRVFVCSSPASVAYFLPSYLRVTPDSGQADFLVGTTRDGCNQTRHGPTLAVVQRLGAPLSYVVDLRPSQVGSGTTLTTDGQSRGVSRPTPSRP